MGNVWSFSAGFQSSKGVKWVEGDEIMVGKEKVRVVAVDREKNVLKVDRAVQWEKDTPVNYAYTGAGPDIGAVESR